MSARLNRILENSLLSAYGFYGGSRNARIQEHTINKLFLNVYKEENSIEIPLLLHDSFLNSTNLEESFIIPLGIGRTTEYKTVDAIISCIIGSTPYLDREIICVNSEKFGTYYGARGIILNKDLNILFIPVAKYTINGSLLEFDSFKLYVNPIVSIAGSGIEKYIYTKIVPKCLLESFLSRFRTDYCTTSIPIQSRFEVSFKDVTNRFISKPIAPKILDYNKEIKEMLLNDVDIIVDSLKLCR